MNAAIAADPLLRPGSPPRRRPARRRPAVRAWFGRDHPLGAGGANRQMVPAVRGARQPGGAAVRVGQQRMTLPATLGLLAVQVVDRPDRPAADPWVGLRPVHHCAQLRDGVHLAAAHAGVAVLPHQVVGPPAHPLHRPRIPRVVVHMCYPHPVDGRRFARTGEQAAGVSGLLHLWPGRAFAVRSPHHPRLTGY
jgi:hypothetical protein